MKIGFNWWYVIALVGVFFAYELGQWRFAKATPWRRRYGKYLEWAFIAAMSAVLEVMVVMESGRWILQFNLNSMPEQSAWADILTILMLAGFAVIYGCILYWFIRKGEQTRSKYRVWKTICSFICQVRDQLRLRRQQKIEEEERRKLLERRKHYRMIDLKTARSENQIKTMLIQMSLEEQIAYMQRCQQSLANGRKAMQQLQQEFMTQTEPETEGSEKKKVIEFRRQGKTLEELDADGQRLVMKYLATQPQIQKMQADGVELRFACLDNQTVKVYASRVAKSAKKA